jgi:sugar lactone lactonase YvrE
MLRAPHPEPPMRAALLLGLLAACTPSTQPASPQAGKPTTAAPDAPPHWEAAPGWMQATDLGPTHGGLAFDRAGRLWAGTDGAHGLVAFAPDGRLVAELPALSGAHSLLLHEVQGEERLIVAHLREHRVVETTLDGRVLWELGAPMDSGAYRKPEEFMPTAVALAPDGRLFVADGYGTSMIHSFDAQRHRLRSFAGLGSGPELCSTPHGLAIDTRFGAPRLLVCDRENRRLVHFDLDGGWLGVHSLGLRRPCAVAFDGERLLVAELEGGVAILDRNGKLLGRVGENLDEQQQANYGVPSSAWSPSILCASHAVALDARGNLFVEDWSSTGRLSRFVRS